MAAEPPITPSPSPTTLPSTPPPPDATPATGQTEEAGTPTAPPTTAPALPEHPYARAMTQLQDIKGDAAVLLHTGAQLITDEIERLRTQAAADRTEIVVLRERAHAAEIDSSVLEERVRTLAGQRRFRDAILALGGVLAGVGFSLLRESTNQQDTILGLSLFIVGVGLIAATTVFLNTGTDQK